MTLFFAISGFLITTLLLRERDATGRISLRNFYARRTLRIFPLYYLVLTGYAIAIWRHERLAPDAQEFFQNLKYFSTYTSNWFVRPGARFYLAWSLATEEQFYLFWPFVVAFSRRKMTPVIIISAVLLYVLAMRALIASRLVDFGHVGNRALTSMSPAICLGCLLAYALHERRSFRYVSEVLSRPLGAAGVVTILAISLAVPSMPVAFIELSSVGLVGVAILCSWPPLVSVLGNWPVRYVGIISYGMYLFNLISVNVARRLVPNGGFKRVAAAAVIAIAIASISWYTFEALFRRIKDRFRRSGRSDAQREVTELRHADAVIVARRS